LLNGDEETGITIQTVKLKVDSGDILLQKKFNIEENDDLNSLEEKVAAMSKDLVLEVLSGFEKNSLKPEIQDEAKVTKCRLIKKEDGLIDWEKSGKEITNKIRAFSRWPVAFSYIEGKKINIYSSHLNKNLNFTDYKEIINGKVICASKNNGIVVKCRDSLINIDILQTEGKKILECLCFLNGCQNFEDKIFTSGVMK